MEISSNSDFMSDESSLSDIQTQTQTQTQTQSSDDTFIDSQELYQYWAKLEPETSGFTTLRLINDKYTAGRDPRNDIIFTKSNIDEEKARRISSFHFMIERVEVSAGAFVVFLCDTSHNGTFINRRLLKKGNRVVLEKDDKIAIGKTGHTGNDLLDFTVVFKFTSFNGYMELNLPPELRTDYIVLKKLGAGAAGEVDMIFCKSSFNSYAMKSIAKSKITSSGPRNPIHDPRKIANEVNILQKLKHPCIVSLVEMFETPEKVHIVLELMEGGELFDRVSENHGLEEDVSKFMFLQICHAVDYLHSRSITHRDLKPENILLASDDKYPVVKVSDFGMSKIADSHSTFLRTFCGTMMYVAPEILKTHGIGIYTSQVDIWSLGVILYIMLSGITPFSGHNKQMSLENQIKRGFYRFPNEKFGGVSLDAKNVIQKMLTVDCRKRVTIKNVLTHSWLTQDVEIENKVNELIYGSPENENTPPNSNSKVSRRLKTDDNHVFDIPGSVPKRVRF